MNAPLEDRLRTELREDAADVGLRAGFVASTVASVLARRRRRQYGVVATAAAVAAVLALGGVAVDAQSDNGATPPVVDDPTPSPTPDAPAVPDTSPPELKPEDMQPAPTPASLPWRETALPRVLPVDVAAAPALSEDPVDHALALVAGPGASVGVVGEDGRLRRLDGVDLVRPRDPDGYRSSPVEQGSLTSDGARAAFPQPGGVVVVDLATGSSQRFDVPGLNTRVVWHPDRRQVLVGQERGLSSILDTADGSVDDAQYADYRSAFAPNGTGLQVTDASTLPVASQLVRWDEDSAGPVLPLSVWSGSETLPSATDRQLVVAGQVYDDSGRFSRYVEGWIVLDIDTGTPVAMLRAGAAGHADWLFGFHDWLDDETVLLQSQGYLLAWTPSTGALERVTEASGYDMSLATGALD